MPEMLYSCRKLALMYCVRRWILKDIVHVLDGELAIFGRCRSNIVILVISWKIISIA